MGWRCCRSICSSNRYHDGKFAEAWSLNTAPTEIAGLGPFRLKQYVPGQKVVLERNPYYWKVDRANARLPYLDELVFLFVGTEDAQVMRFESGDDRPDQPLEL